MYGYIYKTTNKLNGKIYVGQHKHENFDKHYIGSGVLLQEAIERFGADNFTCEIIEACDSLEELNLREIGQVLDLSESRICQIMSQSMSRLRASLRGWQNT